MPPHHFDTRLIHAAEREHRVAGAATLPIFQCSVFEYEGEAGYHDIRYPRLSNLPNHALLGDKLAALEGAEAGLVTTSGMAAIATTLLTLLGAGDHVLAQDSLYGGTHSLVTRDLRRFGVEVDLADAADPAAWKATLRPTTRVIYTEAITNPTMKVADHRAVVAFAREHGLVSVVDNTFASPVNFRPLELGYDLCLHSATKYLNGHSDLTAGAVVGRRELVERIKHGLDHLGGSLDPHACFLLHRGLKTLGLRVRQQNESALAIARHLEGRDEIAAVHYPGLPSHAGHGIARDLFAGFGGMLAFELGGGLVAARDLIDRLELPLHAPSLGGLESLVTIPASTTHQGMSPDERRAAGIADGLVRLSVGIEHAGDLIADLDQALR